MAQTRPNSPPHLILVVEDEAIIRMEAIEVLVAEGFVVLEAAHAAEAVRVLTAQHADIHLLFTDHNMPGDMKGLHLAHHVKTHWPWIGILFTSGLHVGADDLPSDARFLLKPYAPVHMLQNVCELVAIGQA